MFYILMHSHVDIGYTDTQPNIAKKQAGNVFRALELIKQTKNYPAGSQFKWNLEVYWPVEQFLKSASQEQKLEFEAAVRDGQIGIDAMLANLLTGAARSEELLRQFWFATEMGRKCGVAVDSMMISDVPGLTWGMVPALAQAGVKYVSDGPNGGDRIGYVREMWENKPFYWLSPSGRQKVLYWGAQGGYAIAHGRGTVNEVVAKLGRQLADAKYPYDASSSGKPNSIPSATGGREVSLRCRATALVKGRQRSGGRNRHAGRARLEREVRLSEADRCHDPRGIRRV